MIHTCVYLLHVFLKSGTCVGLLVSKLFSKNTIFLRLGQAGAVFLASALRNAVPLHTSALRHSRMRSGDAAICRWVSAACAAGRSSWMDRGCKKQWMGDGRGYDSKRDPRGTGPASRLKGRSEVTAACVALGHDVSTGGSIARSSPLPSGTPAGAGICVMKWMTMAGRP